MSQRFISLFRRFNKRRGAQAHPLLRQEQAAAIPGEQALHEQPVIVFDLETSGLNLRRDVVLSLGAVRIERGTIPLAGQLDCVLRVKASLNPHSQLVHGLRQEDLQAGMEPRRALLQLLDYGAGCIWLAFHAEFDRRMLERALQQHLGLRHMLPVLDVAALAPMLFPQHARLDGGLDHWASVFGLSASARHSAVSDAMLTAEITLILLCEAQRQGLHNWGQLAGALRQWQGRQSTDNSMAF